MEECIFCAIAKDSVKADKVFEDDEFIVFKDVHPKAPLHLLLIPKKHIRSVDALAANDEGLVGRLLLLARTVARAQGVADRGYKLVFNVGRGGGQIIDHLHLHLLGGWGSKPEGFVV